MIINIEKRSRLTINDDWSAWASTTDAAPYTDTDLVEYRVVSQFLSDSYLTSSVVTTNTNGAYTVSGTGVFDNLMETVTQHIDAQYLSGRIKGTDYATVYLGSMQTVLAQAVQYIIGGLQAMDKQRTTDQQIAVMKAQEELYIRQKEAFDDNKYQKLFEAQLNYNGMVFQDATNPDVLDVALEAKVNDVFNKLTNDLPISTMPEA